ncbi:MAG: hypothetical protein COY11_02870 [Candidatus Portnoybacteria bacterium CG_4_10_14_0_2_um_filter_44_20]|uniref:DUF2333 domain-containing protein n=4 Tax=Candidatus Portnoyibacteriota TaxID=1817913 RepID=A0A2H0KQ00_9BACT|nr:MAG: hypothetical protein COV85_03155 [Candidatus Portnoybacteria bacterium CG11_big_fil_rev_8_21_14_0_20_44_10]PIZ70293.1 MAG: hypothetical protein COY11_02870 [Candidatus Portnoybacteria bacterium CG_4_10_14_0_2_um_filter_44_20]
MKLVRVSSMGWIKGFFFGMAALFVLSGVAMFMNYSVPTEPFQVTQGNVRGQAFTWVSEELMCQELDWGWLPNDMFWPTMFLDNRPNFQLGVLDVVRRNALCAREYLSRQRATDAIDKLLDRAFTLFSNGPEVWIWPVPEWKYAKGIEKLKIYSQNLENKSSTFFPRADNLIPLANYYLSIMGDANTQLMQAMSDGEDKTPWLKVDDNFYYVKGVAWALYHSMRAVKVDFADVLRDKNCEVLVDRILADLKRCLDIDPVYVCNGGGRILAESFFEPIKSFQ